jgi:DNA polymerase-3 subunit delta
VTIEDVRALVPEAIPGSTWAFLDAVAMRQSAAAASLAVRLLDSTPPPVLVTVLHRRVRELIMVSDLLASGLSQPEIMRSLRMHEFVVRKLAAHSRNWTAPELDAALDGLLELDVALKGADGATAGDAQFRLLVAAWLADHIGGRH